MLGHVLTVLATLVLLLVAVVLLVFDLCLLYEVLRWVVSPGFRRWLQTPPGPWREDWQKILAMLRAAWKRTGRLLRLSNSYGPSD